MNLLPIDEQQRKQALDTEHSFIVQAPAGSGKTYLLTQRYLKLLAEKCTEPETILALTFTNKAANEMRERILTALKKARDNSFLPHEHLLATIAKQVLERDRALNWNILQNPKRLRIQTLDAFSLYLAQQLPITSRFGTSANITDSPQMLYQKAARRLLQALKNNIASEALQNLVLHLENNYQKLEELLSDMLSHRDQWLPLVLQQNHQSLAEVLNHHLAIILEQLIDEANNSVPLDIQTELLQLLQFASVLSSFPDISIDHFTDWKKIASFLLTKEGEWRKTVNKNHGFPAASESKNAEEKALFKEMKQRMEALLLHCSEHNDIYFKENLYLLQQAPDYPYQTSHIEIIEALFTLLPILTAELMLIFKEHQCVDFVEIQQRALAALGDIDDPSDITLKLDHKIEHVLIDEFQDTSISQFQLIKKITQGFVEGDGRTIFLVGDPMQSIYGFRAAEVGIFLQVKQNGIGDIKPIFLQLKTNFRSHGDLVQFYNQTFSSIFPRHDHIHEGAISYASSEAFSMLEDSKASISDQEFGDEESENQFIAQQIKQIQTQSPDDSIAILVQKRLHLKLLLPLLQQQGISYQAVDIENLFEKSIIHDLYALTRALLFLHDRIAWLSVLRAPWCGLTLQELHHIASVDSSILIWERLQQVEQLAISDESKIRITHLISVFSNALQQTRRLSLRTLIEQLWQHLNGPACLIQASELEIAQQFFLLLEQHEYAGDLLDVYLFETELKTLYAGAKTNQSKLQIMTIHKSKGLEFDHVFLPFLHRNQKTTHKKLMMWLEKFHPEHQRRYLMFAPFFSKNADKEQQLQQFIKIHHDRKNDYEQQRLMYVAYTRAKKALYLSKTKNTGTDVQVVENPTWNMNAKRLTTINPVAITSKTYRKPSHYELELVDIHKQAFGTLAHHFLQHLGEQCLTWQEKEIEWIKNKYPEFAQSFEKLIINLQQDEQAHWIFSQKHQFIQKEFALSTTHQNKVKAFILDRTFVDSENRRWIIDFKTTDVSPELDLASFMQKQQELYQKQLENYAKLFHKLDDRPIFLGLYFPLIPSFYTWPFQFKETETDIQIGTLYGEPQ